MKSQLNFGQPGSPLSVGSSNKLNNLTSHSVQSNTDHEVLVNQKLKFLQNEIMLLKQRQLQVPIMLSRESSAENIKASTRYNPADSESSTINQDLVKAIQGDSSLSEDTGDLLRVQQEIHVEDTDDSVQRLRLIQDNNINNILIQTDGSISETP